jgi:GNAT superfamily N-acetyltransferase
VTGLTVRRLGADSDLAEIVAMLSRAFWDDPLFDFLSGGNLLTEYRVLPHVFHAAVTDFRSEMAELYVAEMSGRPRSFAGWLGPRTFPRSGASRLARNLRAATVLMRLHNRRAAASLLAEVERRHPTEPHWYLALLGTDPSVQGRGLGTTVLGPVLGRCDTDGVPAYTETQRQENVAWYRRCGFAVIDELRIRRAPPIWRLWRDPQSAGTAPDLSENAVLP